MSGFARADARAQPVVALLKDKDGADTVFVDLSPLRIPVLPAQAPADAEEDAEEERHEGDEGEEHRDAQLAIEPTPEKRFRVDIADLMETAMDPKVYRGKKVSRKEMNNWDSRADEEWCNCWLSSTCSQSNFI